MKKVCKESQCFIPNCFEKTEARGQKKLLKRSSYENVE